MRIKADEIYEIEWLPAELEYRTHSEVITQLRNILLVAMLTEDQRLKVNQEIEYRVWQRKLMRTRLYEIHRVMPKLATHHRATK